MTRSEHLQFCQQCLNRKFDKTHGLVCGLTGNIADFDPVCENFAEDKAAVARAVSESVPQTVDRSGANKDMIWGAIWCVGGIIGTVANTGYIFWGAIVFGAIQFFRGLSRMN